MRTSFTNDSLASLAGVVAKGLYERATAYPSPGFTSQSPPPPSPTRDPADPRGGAGKPSSPPNYCGPGTVDRSQVQTARVHLARRSHTEGEPLTLMGQ